MLDLAATVDLDRYPLDRPELWGPICADAHAALAAHGVTALAGFLRPDAVEAMCAEARELESDGHHSEVWGTPYLALPDESFPAGHPRRVEVWNSLTAIGYDQFPLDSLLRRLYESAELLAFIEAILDRGRLHRYADPLGALNVAVMREGDELGWHFDMTDFVVSIALRSSERGGDFESATRVRAADDERYGAVAAVLAGEVDGVEHIAMEPGTLLLFEGRQSLHRVTPIEGPRPRYVALLAFDTKPGTDSSELLKAVRYGRTTPKAPPATIGG